MLNQIHSSETKVNTAIDISKFQPIYFPDSFIQHLLNNDFIILKCDNENQEYHIANCNILFRFNREKLQIVKNINDEVLEPIDIQLPNSLDQWKMLLACFGIIKLPISYKSDEQKLKEIQNYLDMKISVCDSLLHGSDNADDFNIINSAFKSLNDVSKELKSIMEG